MVTRTVVCVSASEAAKLAAEASSSSGSAEEDSISIIKRASISTNNNDGNNEERSYCDNNELERHVVLQVGFRTIRVQQRGAVRPTPTPAQPTTTNSNNNSNNNNDGGALSTSEDIVIGNEITRRQRAAGFEIDLSDVPPQLPILRSAGRMKEGASKYAGVYFHEGNHNWRARITIEGKLHHIGWYEKDEDAAADYARAVFKYKGQETLNKVRKQNLSIDDEDDVPPQPKRQRLPVPEFVLDLSDVPPQQPILKSKGRIKEGSSKYTGVYFNKAMNKKWQAQIRIEGKNQRIGSYENEEDAAIDYARAVYKYKGEEGPAKARERNSYGSGDAAINYARAVFKYQDKGQETLNKVREQNLSIDDVDDVPPQPKCQRLPDPEFVLDLSDVPPQQPIPKSKGRIKEGASKYTGVYFNKANNKWCAQIVIDGKQRLIGYYENEEEAAIDYARALFKYKGQEALDKVLCCSSGPGFDLSDIPPQLPIPKRGIIKEGASKYAGVTFETVTGKWKAQITLERKNRHIGHYVNEEEAAIDYARAVFKYHGQEALDIAREQTSSAPSIDLSDVPPQQPIPKSEGYIKEGASKYAGVTFIKARNKWQAQIVMDGKHHHIGHYVNEEEAAIDYARAKFKYKRHGGASHNARKQYSSAPLIDLSDVSPQLPIPKSKGYIKEGSSKYTGVTFNKSTNKWKAEIRLGGKTRHIGYYEKEEEAAIDYARAKFKYKCKRQGALGTAREQNSSGSGEQKSSGSGIVTSYSTSSNAAYRYRGEKKRAPTSEASISDEETTSMKHQRMNAFGKRNSQPRVIPIKAASVAAKESWSSAQASNISSAPIVHTNQQRTHYWHTPWQWQWQWHH